MSGGQDLEGMGNRELKLMGMSIFEGEENILGLDHGDCYTTS